jgi:predicted membrane-bound spermidine synthase
MRTVSNSSLDRDHPGAGRREARSSVAIVFLLFFLSGFAALLYQVIWQRMLAVFSGIDVYSVTIIVAAFMAGLGTGSLAGGYVADRVSDRRRLLLFALSEFAVALFALVSKWVFYDLLYLRLHDVAESPGRLAVVLFVALLWPTFFMGMSLPLLSRSLTRNIRAAAGTVGMLYGLTTLGAAVGAFATAWFVLRAVGFETSIQIGAALNLVCAIGVLVITPSLIGRTSEDVVPVGESNAPAAGATRAEPQLFSLSTWVVIYALSGFIALSLEIVWFRILGVLTKPSAFTFANLLALFLVGLAAGTLVGVKKAPHSVRPGRIFLLLQAAIPIYAGVSLAFLVFGLGSFQVLDGLWKYLGGYESIDLRAALKAISVMWSGPGRVPPEATALVAHFVGLYFIVPAVLIVPATMMMGISFPFLQKAVQTDRRVLGSRVGYLQTANIVGSMLGAILTGWLLLGFLGTPGTLKILILLGLVFLLLWCRTELTRESRVTRRLGYALVAAVSAACFVFVPRAHVLWAGLHGSNVESIIFEEDASGLSVLKSVPEGFHRGAGVFVNGLGQSWIPYGGIHTLLGAIPVLLHPNPRNVAVIGLGSGDTLFALGARRETEKITCYELIGAQRRTLEVLQRKAPYGGLTSILEDPRIRFVIADGRAAIMRSDSRHDVIEADALRPNSAYAGNLYSYEYFELLRRRLEPRGLAVTWSPTRRVVRTFTKAFPHVLHLDHILIGSNEPIAYDFSTLLERARDPLVQTYYERGGVDIVALISGLQESKVRIIGPQSDRSMLSDINSDLFPKDEYLVRRR